MPTFTDVDESTIGDLRNATGGPFKAPVVRDRPFGCPMDTVLDIPIPPSVNETRRLNRSAIGKHEKWRKVADKVLMASGQLKKGWRNIERYELTVTLDEKRCRTDPDNVLKSAIDYLRRIEVITNDARGTAARSSSSGATRRKECGSW